MKVPTISLPQFAWPQIFPKIQNVAKRLIPKRVNSNRVSRSGWSAELDLADKGRADGLRGCPAEDSIELCGTQAEIVHYCDSKIRAARNHLAQDRNRMIKAYQAVPDLEIISELGELAGQVQLTVNSTLAADRSAILQARESGQEREEEYERFRADNQLNRGALIPRFKWLRWLAISILAATMIGLCYYWNVGQESNSWLVACIWAASATLLPATVGARLVKNLNHTSFTRFLVGAVSVIGVTIGLAVLGLVYHAEITDAISLATSIDTLKTVISDPAILLTIDWGIPGTFLAVGITSLLAGYSVDDPYPGYSESYTAMKAARDRYFALLERSHSKIVAKVKAHARSGHQLNEQFRKRSARFNKSEDRFLGAHQRYTEFEKAVEQTGNLLLDEYRQTNRDMRKTHWNEPASFSLRYKVEPSAAIAQYSSAAATEKADVGRTFEQLKLAHQSFSRDLASVQASLLAEVDHLADNVSMESNELMNTSYRQALAIPS